MQLHTSLEGGPTGRLVTVIVCRSVMNVHNNILILRLLGKFTEAAKDLSTACRIDFDETADEWLKEVPS